MATTNGRRLSVSSAKGIPVACAICRHAFGYVRDGALWIYARHNSEWHGLRITPELLEKWLSAEMEWYSRDGDVYHNCAPYAQRKPAEYMSDGVYRCVYCGKEWDTMKRERR